MNIEGNNVALTPPTPATSLPATVSSTAESSGSTSSVSFLGTQASIPVAHNPTTDLFQVNPHHQRESTESLAALFRGQRVEERMIAGTDGEGNMWVKTADGYLIRFAGKDQKWTITTPIGETTTIWGDPHVIESDGDKFDFDKTSSFVFGENKVTVETVKHGNALSFSSQVTIYNGDQRFTVSGIDKDQPKFEALKFGGKAHDEKLEDGDHYTLSREPNGEVEWKKR